MNDSREELISAYIDDELSLDERARVEGWLADSSELRQLHDDLVALRASLQSLPSHTLDHDLAASVLLRAQQSALRSGDESPAERTKERKVASVVDQTAATIVPGSAWWERGTSWRRVIWPTLAVAAALLVLVYDARQRPADQEVAHAPQRELERAAPPEGSPAGISADESRGAAEPLAEDRNSPPPDRSARLEVRPTEPAGASEPTRKSYGLRGTPAAKESSPMPLDAKSSRVLKDTLRSSDGEAPALVYSVSPQYLQSNTFEKLLDSQKIAWEKVPQSASPRAARANGPTSDAASSRTRTKSKGGELASVTYLLRAGSQRINEVLSKLPPQPGQRADYEGTVRREGLQPLAADTAQVVKVTLIAAPQPSHRRPRRGRQIVAPFAPHAGTIVRSGARD